ncbi:MAG TPA: TIGR02266 family protein [Polyangiales bacterium]|nr:TIGR02266 family protein [Polyangiales bacterium]
MPRLDLELREDIRMADTRKDKRAPVSLKVRFKSATVDEFIEHYSKDVSRGGIYIKSSNPMAVGTLLKFQFQLKDESALIKGVGRVVWTRAEVDATTDSPAGMGIKFIKMDNDSRAIVERIIDTNAPDPGSYVSGRLNATSAEPSSAPPPASGGGNFFPDLPPAELPPPEDRTAVRHATQFLANALKEGNDEATAAEAALKAEEAKKRQDEVEAERKAEAAKPVQEEPAVEQEPEPKSPLPSMIIDPSLDARPGRPSEVARETDVTPLPRPYAAIIGPPGGDDASEPDTEPPPPLDPPPRKSPTTSIPVPGAGPKRNLVPILAIAVVLAIAAWVALRGGPEETVVDEPPVQPAAVAPAAKVEEPTPEPVAEPALPVEELTPDAAVAVEEKPIAGAEVALVSVHVAPVPREAEIYVGGEKKGEGNLALELPIGSASTVSARAKGYLDATQTVTPVAGKRVPAIKLKLKPLPFIVHVETTPPGAAINVAGVKGVTPTDLTLDRPPTQELSVTAKLDGYERALTRIPPGSFSEGDNAMRTQLNLTLQAKLPEATAKEATPEPAPKKPAKKATPRANIPSEKPVEGAEPAKAAEEPAAAPPPPADPEPPKEEPKPEPLPGNPFGN